MKNIFVTALLFVNTFAYSQENLFVFKDKTSFFGVLNKKTEQMVVVADKYTNISQYFMGKAVAKDENQSFYLLDENGNAKKLDDVIEVFGIKNGLICAKNSSEKYGYLNLNAEIALPFDFDIATAFSEDLALVEKNAKTYYINKKGENAFPNLEKTLQKYGSGKVIYPFDRCEGFKYGMAKINLLYEVNGITNENMVIINTKGEVVFYQKMFGKKWNNNWQMMGRIEQISPQLIAIEINNTANETIYCLVNLQKKILKENLLQLRSYTSNRMYVQDSQKQRRGYMIDGKGKEIKIKSYTEKQMKFSPYFAQNNQYIFLDSDSTKIYCFDEGKKSTLTAPISDDSGNWYAFFEDKKAVIVLQNGLEDNFLIKTSVPVEKVLAEDFFLNPNPTEEEQNWGYKHRSALESSDFMIRVQNKNLYGGIDKRGNLTIPCVYDTICPFEGNYKTFAKKNGKWGEISYKNDILEPFVIDDFAANGFLKKNGKWGKKGFLPFEYDAVPLLVPMEREANISFDFYVVDKNGKKGVIGINDSQKIEQLLPFEYDTIASNALYGALIVEKNKKQGLIFLESIDKFAIPCEYDKILHLNGLFIVFQNQKMGIHNTKKLLVPCIYDDLYTLAYKADNHYTHFLAKKDNKQGILNIENNKIIVPLQYQEIREIYQNEDYFIAKKNNKYGLVGYENQQIVPFEYDSLQKDYTTEGIFLRATKAKKNGIITQTGQIAIPLEYNEIGAVFADPNQPIAVEKNGKWGFVNNKGKLVIPFASYQSTDYPIKFVNAHSIQEGMYLAVLAKEGKQGIINEKGDILIDFQYKSISLDIQPQPQDNRIRLGTAQKDEKNIIFYWQARRIVIED